MQFSEINPFVRYARHMKLSAEFMQKDNIAYDARLFYVRSGIGVVVADSEQYKLEVGTVLIINSGVMYRYCHSSDDAEYTILNFDYTRSKAHLSTPIPPVSPDSYLAGDADEQCLFSDVEPFNRVVCIPHCNNIESYLSMITDEYNRRLIHNNAATGGLLSYCLAVCARRLQDNDFLKESVSDKIIAYIHRNYNKPVTNMVIAEKFGYHPNYVSTLIKNNTGMPLHKYLIHIRLNRAVEMLESGTMSISEIAHECGFCDSAYFSGYFKKHFGICPTGYKGI